MTPTAVLVGCLSLALCGVVGARSTSARPKANFDVRAVVAGPETLRVIAPDGRRLVVVDDDATVSEIPGVEATVTRVDDVSEAEAGPVGIAIAMAKPTLGVWQIETRVKNRGGVSVTFSVVEDSTCDVDDGVVLPANTWIRWRLTIGTRADGRCKIELRRTKSAKAGTTR
jgi:hypothetical protein